MSESIKQVNDYLISLSKPKNFDHANPENEISYLRKSFSQACTALEEMGVSSPHKLTVFEFNVRIDYFERKHKKQTG